MEETIFKKLDAAKWRVDRLSRTLRSWSDSGEFSKAELEGVKEELAFARAEVEKLSKLADEELKKTPADGGEKLVKVAYQVTSFPVTSRAYNGEIERLAYDGEIIGEFATLEEARAYAERKGRASYLDDPRFIGCDYMDIARVKTTYDAEGDIEDEDIESYDGYDYLPLAYAEALAEDMDTLATLEKKAGEIENEEARADIIHAIRDLKYDIKRGYYDYFDILGKGADMVCDYAIACYLENDANADYLGQLC